MKSGVSVQVLISHHKGGKGGYMDVPQHVYAANCDPSELNSSYTIMINADDQGRIRSFRWA